MKTNTHIHCKALSFPVPPEAAAVLDAAPSVTLATSTRQLVDLAVCDQVDGWHEVAYEVPGKGRVVELRVCRTLTASTPITSNPTCAAAIRTAW
jgi:hypothetical protein